MGVSVEEGGGGVVGNPRLRLPCLINLHLAHSALAAAFSSLSRHTTVAFVDQPPTPSSLLASYCPHWQLLVLSPPPSTLYHYAHPARPLHKPTAKCCFCRSIYVDCNFQLSCSTHTQIHTHTHTHTHSVCDSTCSSHCNCCDYYRFNSP